MSSIFEKYDLVDVNEEVPIPNLPEEGLVVVVGSSGSGKSTILKGWGMEELTIKRDTPIIQLFPTEEEGERYLIQAGLRSVPVWKRPLSCISNGEGHRAEVAV